MENIELVEVIIKVTDRMLGKEGYSKKLITLLKIVPDMTRDMLLMLIN